jgi:hypothetical protein
MGKMKKEYIKYHCKSGKDTLFSETTIREHGTRLPAKKQHSKNHCNTHLSI